MSKLVEGHLEFRDGAPYDGIYTAWRDPATNIIECRGTGPAFYPDFTIHIDGCALPGADAAGTRPIWYEA